MSNEEKLKQIISKAVKNGFDKFGPWNIKTLRSIDGQNFSISTNNGFDIGFHLYQLIFSHDFAKAYFGTKKYTEDWGPITGPTYEAWQYHLMRAALEEDPINYYYQFI